MRWKPQFYTGDSSQPAWRGYVLAIVFTAVAMGVRLALAPVVGDVQPFAFFYLSLALTAWFAGLGPAVLAFVAGLVAGWAMFLEPRFSLDLASIVRMLTYSAVSACFGVLLYFARQSERAALDNAKRLQSTQTEVQQQNAVLKGLAESVIDAILIVSPDGKMIFSNEQFRQMWQFPPEVLASGSDQAALAWAETRVANPTGFRDGVARAYSRPDLMVREELCMKDGRVYDRVGAPVIVNGVQHAWVWTFRDITERKHAEEQAERSRAEQQVILNREADIRQTLELAMRAGRIGTYQWDVVRDDHIWSKQTAEFFGYAPGEFPGTWEGVLNRVHPEDRQWLGGAIEKSFARRERDHSFHYRALRPDGSIAWLIVRGRVEYSEDGKPLRVVGVVVDVTALKQSEQALAAARNQLAEHAANLERAVAERTAELTETIQELEAFSYSLSHDMRAPLRAMKGFSEIIEAEYGSQLGPEALSYLSRIGAAASRLDQLIRDVLSYSRLVREEIHLQPIDVENLARQLINENPNLQPPRAEIEFASPLHVVLGHEAYLMQVLSNLVDNAVKFIAPDQQPRVRIWTQSADTTVLLLVRDNGIGIPKEAQKRMFGMFQRMHSDQEYEGTGIGLAIVRKAVERMGGRVGLESEPGKGSTFWVELHKPDSVHNGP
jgi:PAS domain S-box-containing protein